MAASAPSRLWPARLAWLAVTLPALLLFARGLPVYYQLLQTVCPAAPCGAMPSPDYFTRLAAAGLTPSFAAGFKVALNILNVLFSTAVAAVIIWRRPTDRMAWYTAVVLPAFATFGIQQTAQVLGVLAVFPPIWSGPVYFYMLFGGLSFTVFLFIFPDGRFVPRWLIFPVGCWLVSIVAGAFFPGNPFDVDYWPPLANVAFWGFFLGLCGFAQVYRYRRVSTPAQRQQTKWAVWGIGVAMTGALVAYAFTGLAPSLGPHWAPLALAQDTSYFAFQILVSLSIGVAILRSGLYDIDVVIRRTLLYGLLTALLAAVYAALIVGLGAALSAFTGQGQNQLVTVLSTLAIAALALPLRRRLQGFVDRRFYRRRYDAARILAQFALTARAETDLDQLAGQLEHVVQATMQPAHVGLWLPQHSLTKLDRD